LLAVALFFTRMEVRMKWVPLLVVSLFAVTTAAAETASPAGSPLARRWKVAGRWISPGFQCRRPNGPGR